jgi:hypothetical protein
MNIRARWSWLLVAAPLVAVNSTAYAQGQPPTVTYGPPPTSSPPPTYYSPPALPQPPPPAAGAPNAYPISPRDYGAGPETLGFREGMFIPPGYHLGTRPHRILLLGGVGLISAAYVLGLTVGAFDGFDNQKGWLFLPIAGPFITSSRRHSCRDSSLVACTVNDSGASTFLVIDGVVQSAGALTMLLAVAVQEKVLRRNDSGVIVAPSAIAGGAGVTALGRF